MRIPLRFGALGPRAIALWAGRNLRLRVEGAGNVPLEGPALIAARHYHHLYDGAALILGLHRMIHIFVALDWVKNERERKLMEWACDAARWPVALRAQQVPDGARSGRGAYASEEVLRYVRRSLATAGELLREGRVVAVFPEGFPTIEPGERRTRADGELLAFAAGFTSIAQLAQRGGRPAVPIVPAGLEYHRAGAGYDVTLRFGEPLFFDGTLSREQAVRWIETRVRALSGLA